MRRGLEVAFWREDVGVGEALPDLSSRGVAETDGEVSLVGGVRWGVSVGILGALRDV